MVARQRIRDRFPVGGEFFEPIQTGPESHPTYYTMGVVSISRGWSGQGVALTSDPNLVPRLKKKYSHISALFLGFHGLFEGELYPFFTESFSINTLSGAAKYLTRGTAPFPLRHSGLSSVCTHSRY
jgi:hypothetical protein